MSVEAQKLELIEWILKLKDASAIKAVMKIKNSSFKGDTGKTGSRKFSKKRMFTHAVEDTEDSLYDPVKVLDDLTQKYSSVNEDDLDILGIYEQREHHHDRGIVFD